MTHGADPRLPAAFQSQPQLEFARIELWPAALPQWHGELQALRDGRCPHLKVYDPRLPRKPTLIRLARSTEGSHRLRSHPPRTAALSEAALMSLQTFVQWHLDAQADAPDHTDLEAQWEGDPAQPFDLVVAFPSARPQPIWHTPRTGRP